jgi:hypothetical protein
MAHSKARRRRSKIIPIILLLIFAPGLLALMIGFRVWAGRS